MDKIKNYDIPFFGLKTGIHDYSFEIKKAFFELFDVEQEFSDCDIKCDLAFNKTPSMLELNFKIDGFVIVPCDLTSENFPLKINNKFKLIVNFSDHFDDSDDELLVLPIGEHTVNVAKFIYEGIIVAIPLKKVNPESLKSEEYEKIQQFIEKNNTIVQNSDESESIDERWKILEKLKNNKLE